MSEVNSFERKINLIIQSSLAFEARETSTMIKSGLGSSLLGLEDLKRNLFNLCDLSTTTNY